MDPALDLLMVLATVLFSTVLCNIWAETCLLKRRRGRSADSERKANIIYGILGFAIAASKQIVTMICEFCFRLQHRRLMTLLLFCDTFRRKVFADVAELERHAA